MGASSANYCCSLDRNVDNLDQGGHCRDGERQSDLEHILEVGSTELLVWAGSEGEEKVWNRGCLPGIMPFHKLFCNFSFQQLP